MVIKDNMLINLNFLNFVNKWPTLGFEICPDKISYDRDFFKFKYCILIVAIGIEGYGMVLLCLGWLWLWYLRAMFERVQEGPGPSGSWYKLFMEGMERYWRVLVALLHTYFL